ncbi:dolichol kinase [Tetranychus urticae]|uniref:dolichol kinase n=1 Tax=Tetranychus urticae TaxID=32264 RepID=T1JVD6_TETUR|nr:dolichol kinase [Tetranychus urticae]
MKGIPRIGSGWRTSAKCPFCLCPFLVVANILMNVLTTQSTTCYRLSLFIAINFFLVTYKNVAFLKPPQHSLAVSFIVTVAVKFYIPEFSWFIFPILALFNYGFNLFTKSINRRFLSSFSQCELIIVSQGILTFLAQSTLCELVPSVPDLALSCSNDPTTRVLQILFFGLSMTVAAMLYSATQNDNLIYVYTSFFTGLFLIYSRIAVILNKEPLTWLFLEIIFTSTRIHLFELWACLFLFAVFFCVVVAAFANGSSNTVIRKFFHLIIIPVYASGLKYDSILLHFLSSCLLWIFILLETLRITDPDNTGKAIEFFMERFKNENDQGFLTLTHIYLLVGLSLSTWLSPNIDKISFNLTSGLITVAVGDTAAGIIGSLFGKHKWPNSKKSFEGTFGAIFFQILASIFLISFLKVPTNFVVVIILCVISSILEAKTVQIDNLILPLYFNLLWLIFEAISNL